MALIGNGAQSEFQAIAFHRMLGIRELRLFDTDPQATAKLERNLAPPASQICELRACVERGCGRAGADIVTTVTADKRNALILTPQMIAPGMHLNAVGGDCPGKTELHADILRMPNARIVVEYEPQSRIEGEIQQMNADYPVHRVRRRAVRAARPGRTARRKRSRFSIRSASRSSDYSALRYPARVECSEERGSARQIDLVPELDDPKDLYGGTLRLRARPRMRQTARRMRGARHEARSSCMARRVPDRRAHRHRRRHPRRVHGARGAARGRHRTARSRRSGLEVSRPRQLARAAESAAAARAAGIVTSPRSRHGIARCTMPCTASYAGPRCRSCWAAITA